MKPVIKTDMYQVCINKNRTGMIGKGQQIFCFSLADPAAAIQIRGDFGPHGIAAQKAQKQGIGS
ncbi:hypothetical protein F170042I7_17930 [Blautia caecimuris]